MIISVPEFDPVAIYLGPILIRWYSLAYIFGILFVTYWIKKANKKENFMSQKAYDDWLVWAICSILIGGRIGYVLFYNFSYFANNPLEIIAFWNGGMSFHGGLLGAIFGCWIFCKKYKIQYLKLTDTLAVSAPIALFFGRIANFINLELYGRATNSDYGFIFPNAGDFPRHPSQLYEAFLEGILLFIILFTLNFFSKFKESRGFLSGIFLIGYASFRILVENFREPDEQIGFLLDRITMGQVLSLPLIFVGIILVTLSLNSKKK